jgi:hypothetical protein
VGWNGLVKKYLIYGQRRDTFPDPSLRIFNVVGLSYGFMTDAAYVIDFNTGAEFMLTATIYVNENDILGDGKYEYYQLGMPFLRDLGLGILKMERKRERKYISNFKEFRFNYNEPD